MDNLSAALRKSKDSRIAYSKPWLKILLRLGLGFCF